MRGCQALPREGGSEPKAWGRPSEAVVLGGAETWKTRHKTSSKPVTRGDSWMS